MLQKKHMTGFSYHTHKEFASVFLKQEYINYDKEGRYEQ